MPSKALNWMTRVLHSDGEPRDQDGERGDYQPLKLSSSLDQDNVDENEKISENGSVSCSIRRPSGVERVAQYLTRAVVTILCIWGIVNLVYLAACAVYPEFTWRSQCDSSSKAHKAHDSGPAQAVSLDTGDRSCYCGETLSEALSRGCDFDPLASAILPPHCIDRELTDIYMRKGPNPDGSWTYWADREHTIPLTTEQVREFAGTDTPYYSPHRWHQLHCLYTWRRQWRMWNNESGAALVAPTLNTYSHLEHCSDILLLEKPAWGKMAISWVLLNVDE